MIKHYNNDSNNNIKNKVYNNNNKEFYKRSISMKMNYSPFIYNKFSLLNINDKKVDSKLK